jgi:hypothetical protein
LHYDISQLSFESSSPLCSAPPPDSIAKLILTAVWDFSKVSTIPYGPANEVTLPTQGFKIDITAYDWYAYYSHAHL